jgi:hypothetical protein
MSRHLFGLVLAVVLATSGSLRGVCFMPGSGEPVPRDAHACCKTGWTAGAPECCMAGAAGAEPARTAVPAALVAPASIRLDIAEGSPRVVATALRPGDRSHSPPGPTPLRI